MKRAQERPHPKRHIYGINPVLEALRAQAGEVERLYVLDRTATSKQASDVLGHARALGIEIEEISRESLAAMAKGGVHQGVVAQLRGFKYAELANLLQAAVRSASPLLLLVLDGVQDPQNLGAVIRSAYALGAHGVVIPQDRSAQVSGAVVKASAGATELCPVARVVNLSRALEAIKKAGAWIVAADPMAKEPISDAKLSGHLAVVVGGESTGIRAGVLKHCDLRVSIPMAGRIGSLNASVAAAIVLYEIARQRRAAEAT